MKFYKNAQVCDSKSANTDLECLTLVKCGQQDLGSVHELVSHVRSETICMSWIAYVEK